MALSSEMTPADIAACTGNNGNGGLFDGGAYWIIILFLFVFCGWGNNGWGGGGASGAADNYVLASDFATLQRQIDSGVSSLEHKGDAIQNGLCDGFYAMNTGLLNGFSGVNTTIMQNGYETRNAIQQAQIAEMQNANALQAQIAQCCCDNKAAIADVKYSNAMGQNAIEQTVGNGFCQTNFNNQNNTRDIIDNQNSNTRTILDALTTQRIEAKDEKIAEQNQQIFAAQLAASQQAQNNYLLSQLKIMPIPAYTVPNPFCTCTTTTA